MADKVAQNKKHFVLVHGFCHGAWSWYKLVSLIKMNGHDVTAVDLAACGTHPKHIDEISSLSEYIQPLMDHMEALPEGQKVILVGHSYGGIPVSMAMDKFPEKVSLGVFVSATMANWEVSPGSLIQEFFKGGPPDALMDSKLTFDPVLNVPVSADFGPEYLTSKVYPNCPPEVQELAKMLVRPNKFFMEEIMNPSLLSEARYGKIKRCFVKCTNDDVMAEEFQNLLVEKTPPEEVVSIPESGHMVMLSKPQELCSVLLGFAAKYC